MRARTVALAALLALTISPIASASIDPRDAMRPARTSSMVRVPAGDYRPLYAQSGAARVRVATFALDRRPVSRADFLAFVRQHPEWRRSRVRTLFAERSYLGDWIGDLDAGSDVDSRRPVTGVSRFAAAAFCAERGARLPTLDEWEYAAAASETRRDASADPSFRRRLLALYAARSSARLPIAGSGAANVYGVRDLHGSAWEWTLAASPIAGTAHSHGVRGAHDAAEHRLYCASAAIGVADPANYPAFVRFAVRSGLTPRATNAGLGFRCAADRVL